jgi:serine/threonine protein phosphatase PrpC
LDYASVYRSSSVPIGVFVVADGMGGHAAGDVASRLTCQVLARRIANDLMVPATEGKLPANNSAWLTDIIHDANKVVFEERQTAHSDMGNTLTVALMIGNAAIIANIGDSRCYQLNQDGIRQITTDHSLVERLVETGQITRAEAAVHPQKNVIYRVVGDKSEVDVDIFEQKLNLGEALLLCSDGLSGMVNDTHIFKLWQSSKSPQEACDRLVEAANQAGGEDNITVVIIQLLP